MPINPKYNYIYNKTLRVYQLYNLIKDLKINRVIRINAGFKVILYDYSDSKVQKIITSNITVPGKQQREKDPSLPRDPHKTLLLKYSNLFTAQNSQK